MAVRRPTTRLVVETDGRAHQAAVELVADPAHVAAPVDWIIVATKTYDTDALAPWFSSAALATANVAVAQNGVEHVERLSRYVAPERVMPVIVTYGAERPAPGHIVQTLVGRVRVPASSLGERFAALSDNGCLSVDLVEDFTTAMWTKLAGNLVGNSLTTLLDVPVRALAQLPALKSLGERLIAECRAVGLTRGANLHQTLEQELFGLFAQYPPTVRSSMWQDRSAGRRLEFDAISGAVARIGSAEGIDVPCSRTVTELLSALSWRSNDQQSETCG
jgi:2-dehydropantoate 2-reductase